MAEEIKQNSPAFLFGQIMTEIRELRKSHDILSGKLEQLPCAAHEERIKTLFNWKANCNGNARARTIARISLKNMLIVAVVSSGLTLFVSWLAWRGWGG